MPPANADSPAVTLQNAEDGAPSAEVGGKGDAPAPSKCPACGTPLPAQASFCPFCGREVSSKKKRNSKKDKRSKERARKRIAGEDSIAIANDLVGVKMAYENGIVESTPGHFSRSIEFTDISYENERRDQQELIFERLCQLHGIFPAKSVYQIDLVNIATAESAIERFLPEVGSTADMARCFNDIIEAQLREGRIGIERRNFLTFAVDEPDVEHAELTLASMRNGAKRVLDRLGCTTTPLDGIGRMRALHEIVRGRQDPFLFDYAKLERSRAHARDYLAPAWAAYRSDDMPLRRSFQMPGRCVQTLWIRDFGSDLSDRAIRGIRALKIPMVISLLFIPQVKKQAVKDIRGNIAAIQGEIYEYQGQIAKSYGDITRLPPHMEEREMESKELLSFLVDKDQNMNWFQGLITVFAPNPEALKSYVQMVRDEAGVWSIDLADLALRQEEAFKSMLPLATTHLPKCFRSLPTAESAIMVPFSSQTVRHNPRTSYYLGQDAVTNEPIFVDPSVGNSPHMWIMGITGAGKSMEMNAILTFSSLCYPRTVYDEEAGVYVPDDEDAPSVFAFDFHGEYSRTFERLGGRVDKLGPSHDNCINPLDISDTAGVLTKKSIQENTDFFIALFESILDEHTLSQRERSLLDRCLRLAYEPHIGKDTRPTLGDLYERLKEQGSDVTSNLADALEMYVHGSMKAFNGQTNIEASPFLESFDCSELGSVMQTFAMLTAMSYVRNKTYENFRRGRPTILIMEEVQILFENEAAVRLLDSFFSELRKYNLRIICITQLPRRVLEHPRASYLFDNSGIFVFLANSKNNVDRIGDLFRLSASQKECMALGVDVGSGLVIAGGVKIAMKNTIPSGNILYELWNTDPDKMARVRKDDSRPAAIAIEEFSDAVALASLTLRIESQDGRLADIPLSDAEMARVLSSLGAIAGKAPLDPTGCDGAASGAIGGEVREAQETEAPAPPARDLLNPEEDSGEGESVESAQAPLPDQPSDPAPAKAPEAAEESPEENPPSPDDAPSCAEPQDSRSVEDLPAQISDWPPHRDDAASKDGEQIESRPTEASGPAVLPHEDDAPDRSHPENAFEDDSALPARTGRPPAPPAPANHASAASTARFPLSKEERRLYLDDIGCGRALAAKLDAIGVETVGDLLAMGSLEPGFFGIGEADVENLKLVLERVGVSRAFEGFWK